MVRTHPETGRKALYVNPGFTYKVEGMDDAAGMALLEELFAHSTQDQFLYRHVWKPHDLVFWDNRCAMHNPVNDYHGYRRIMHRITLAGDVPH
jgi:taurine dioxygenase